MSLEIGSGNIEDIDNPDDHITFIRMQWSQFAAFAWEKYQSEGRGAVVIDFRNASKSGTKLNVPSYYVAEASERLAKRGGWPVEDVADMIRTYDPQLDVIFIFLRLNGDFYYYNVSDDLTPPAAHAKRVAQMGRVS
jgi:hypothetical protein